MTRLRLCLRGEQRLRHGIRTAVAAAMVLTLAACGTDRPAGPTDTPAGGVMKTLEVAPARVSCVGVSTQTCLQVRASSDAPWTLLYDGIIGFEPETGYTYRIVVQEVTIANPPADGSSVQRRLVTILSRTASLIGPTWRLVSIDGRDALPGTRVTATFTGDDRVAGSAGCNRYFGGAVSGGDTLKVGRLGSTLMYCGTDGVMAQEQAYLAALEKVTRYRVGAGQLRLGPESSAPTLAFQAE
jgi:heat shock protein HslJ